ncbi:MAG TPA: Mut7-C RNAse domain-containing protein, partial [Candidatus Hodarchaeales archaeon]|nr:Mut7-C RNAse domain-containing protein [Candidatus Hodarchaeales archaeon]
MIPKANTQFLSLYTEFNDKQFEFFGRLTVILPCIIIDAMCGGLARHLRFYGVDVIFDATKNHFELEFQASRKECTLITLAKRHRIATNCLVIPEDFRGSTPRQLEFLCKIHLIHKYFDLERTRCGLCNTLLEELDEIAARVALPERTLTFYESQAGRGKLLKMKTWICPHCQKYYWEGSHWRNIVE